MKKEKTKVTRRILDAAMAAPKALMDLRVAPRILVVDDDLSIRAF